MMRWSVACVLLLAAASVPAADAPKTHQVKLNGHTFTLPVGFDIELVAGPPLVDRPIVADFDEQGRLYVADSSGSNEKVDVQLKQKPHRIVRLEDTHGDGRYDKQTVFADQMMFPEGCMWYAGSLYVAAPPSIWKLTDTDGDGVADQRVEWFQGKTLTGCANDLHGPYLGPDGWIYWCKGAFAKQTYERPGKPPFVTRASHIFRCRPDGSGLEPVMTGGMDNPVDVVFTPGGERIFTTTFFQHPGGGKRDGLIHAVYGGLYGKVHEPIFEHPWTSPDVLPVLTHMGAAAPCGLVRYESRAFGSTHQDNLFACQFNMHKVSRHVLQSSGATFTTRDEDFVVSDNLDFHPTDVLEDADGSLLVIDTGGWYKLCCPTSQLHKPDVLGGIYRIRRMGAPHFYDPRGLRLDWGRMAAKELTDFLSDPRPAVRRRAIQALGEQGAAAVPVLTDVLGAKRSAEGRRNAVWALTQIDHVGARAAIRITLDDADDMVRQAALHSVSLWRDHEAMPALHRLLLGESPASAEMSRHNQRAAAEALGRIGDKAAVPALLAAAESTADRFVEHALTFALIEIGDPQTTAAGLKHAHPYVRRTALIALDQMPGGVFPKEAVTAELTSPVPVLKETAWWIVSRHPQWGGDLAGIFRDRLGAKGLAPNEREELASQLSRFGRATATQELLAETLRNATFPGDARRIALRAMAQAGLKQAPASWLAAITPLLSDKDTELVREAIATLRTLLMPKQPPADLKSALLRIAKDNSSAVDIRLNALAAVPGGLTQVEPEFFAFLRSQWQPDQPVAIRSTAADVLSHARLTAEQLLTLTDVFKTISPMEVDRLLEPFANSTDEKVGLALLAALKASPVRASLREGMLKPRLAKYSPAVQRQAEELYAALNVDAAKQRAKLEELLAGLKDGDIRRGQAVFHSSKAVCAACHAIGYLGGTVGPDLTHIARIRSDRDLLESIVFPSASFVRSYEPVLVTTKDGKIHNGVVRRYTADEILLATGVNQEVRIARADIEDMQPSKVSIMPAGLDQQLTPRELADLVAFLRACK